MIPRLDRAAFSDLNGDLESKPLERSETIPSAWYVDPRFHALDREAVFGTTWQHVGHVCQVPDTGDHLVASVAGDPVIVVRGKDGVLRGFFNVCRHRGGPLAMKDGNSEMLQCGYHGWTYQLDGMLRGVPHFNRVELFEKKDYGLIPVRLDTWEGLIFVNLAERPRPVGDFFQGARERILPTEIGGLKFGRRADYEVACNWKVYVDNFLEGYHVPYVHPELVKLYDYQSYVTETYDWYSLQVGPLSGNENVYGVTKGEALYYCVFPNFMLNILPGRLQTNVVIPIAPDRCRVEFRYYYTSVEGAPAQKLIAEDHDYSDKVQQEDIEICERVQEGLSSRAYDRGRFSVTFESGVHHFQQLLKGAYRDWLHANGQE